MNKINPGDIYRSKEYGVRIVYVDDFSVLADSIETYCPYENCWKEKDRSRRIHYSPEYFSKHFVSKNHRMILYRDRNGNLYACSVGATFSPDSFYNELTFMKYLNVEI